MKNLANIPSKPCNEKPLTKDLVRKISEELDLNANEINKMENQDLDLMLLNKGKKGSKNSFGILIEKYRRLKEGLLNKFINENMLYCNPLLFHELNDHAKRELQDKILLHAKKYNPKKSGLHTWLWNGIYDGLHKSFKDLNAKKRGGGLTRIPIETLNKEKVLTNSINNNDDFYSSPLTKLIKKQEKEVLDTLLNIACLSKQEEVVLDLYLQGYTKDGISKELKKCRNYGNEFITHTEKKLKYAKEVYYRIFGFYNNNGNKNISQVLKELLREKNFTRNKKIENTFYKALFYYIAKRESLNPEIKSVPCHIGKKYGLHGLMKESKDISFEKYFRN